jgi:hypothetical protein
MVEKFKNFKNLSFVDKCRFIIKLGIFVSVFLEVMEIAIDKFQAIDLDLKSKENEPI